MLQQRYWLLYSKKILCCKSLNIGEWLCCFTLKNMTKLPNLSIQICIVCAHVTRMHSTHLNLTNAFNPSQFWQMHSTTATIVPNSQFDKCIQPISIAQWCQREEREGEKGKGCGSSLLAGGRRGCRRDEGHQRAAEVVEGGARARAPSVAAGRRGGSPGSWTDDGGHH
jgi:hypothetical protein